MDKSVAVTPGAARVALRATRSVQYRACRHQPCAGCTPRKAL